MSKLFRRFASDNELSDTALCGAIRELSAGLIHANLGGGVYKQRIARSGHGKSGGFRTVIFFRAEQRAIFILGFAKNSQESLDRAEVAGLKDLAKEMLNYADTAIARAFKNGTLEELFCSAELS